MERLKLTGLWRGKDRNGETFYSGSVNPTVRLMIFKNSYKKEDRDPDLIAYLVPAEKKDNGKPRAERPDAEDDPF